ncbi:MAG TPA: metallophosphoesterase [Candidatus Sulfopaludibacter sp.]|nr:metallophosphoesterase [Candidatus Sulfopaludibacter sp.]
MSGDVVVAIVSDIHYAGAAERARGGDYELRAIANPLLRAFAHIYRHVVWMRHPLDQAPQLDRFLAEVGPVDYVVANGDYSCDTGFVGVSDAAAGQSAQECLGKLRAKFGNRVRLTVGDHELGKKALFGSGEMRLASWRTATENLGLPPFWQLAIGRYTLMGVTSSLIALPVHQPDTLPAEWPEWRQLREAHLAEIRAAFDALPSNQRVILFCHDPTALPFLWREEIVRHRLSQIEQTIIGHLHTQLILWKSRLLCGIPPIRFLGHNVHRMTLALHEAHLWRPFHVRLCPALSGIELLNDGGYFTMHIDPAAGHRSRFIFNPLPR